MSQQPRPRRDPPLSSPVPLPAAPEYPTDKEIALWRTALEMKDRDLAIAIDLRVQYLQRRGIYPSTFTMIDWLREAARTKLSMELAELPPAEPDVLAGVLHLAKRWHCSPQVARRKLVLGALAYEESLALTCAPLTPKMAPTDDDASQETPSEADQRSPPTR